MLVKIYRYYTISVHMYNRICIRQVDKCKEALQDCKFVKASYIVTFSDIV